MRMNLLKFATCFAIGAAVLVACEPTEMEPVFPDEIITDADVNTTSEVIEFTANLDWELSLPMETISFFWLEDEEGNKLNKLSGKAGTYKVNVGITDEPDFDNDVTCDITLTMGDKSKVIATYTLLKSVKEFKAYPCLVEDGALKYKQEGGFDFSETSATSVELIYNGKIYGFALPISFEAGFNYDIEAPEWLDVDRVNSEQIAIGKRGVCNVMAALDLNELTAETTSGKIEIYVRNSDEKVAEITVTFPSLDSYVSCDLNVAAITQEGKYVTYDEEGEATNNDACSFAVTTTSELTFVLAGLCSNNYWGASSHDEFMYAEFDNSYDLVNIATVDPGTQTGEGLLKTQNVSVAFTENAGAERVAYLLALPQSEISAFNNFISNASEGAELSEDFLKYVIVTFTQEGKAADDNALAATNAEMSLMASTDEMYNALSEVFGTTNIYVLNATSEFTLTYPSDVSPMIYRINSTTGELEDGTSDWTAEAGKSKF